MTAAAPDSHRVERIGDFAVHRVIGEGGMGVVYEATERLSGRRVALKVLHTHLTRSEDARARFFSEMRILAGLEHPNIVRSLSTTEVDGKLVMVLEFLEGRTLREELTARGALGVQRTIAIAQAVTSALGAAHGKQPPIVHRDLKPENLMLLADGSVKVMDFGVAKVLAPGGGGQTRATQAVGTVQYMSPEQAEGRPVTAQTDLYALGLVIYEMLSGKVPFDSPSLLGILRQHCEAIPPPLDEGLRSRLPADLESLLFQLLEKSPDRRPSSTGEVARVLDGISTSVLATSATVAVQTLPMTGGPPIVPRQASAPRKLDTIELVDRFGKKRRWPLFVVGGIFVIAAIAVPWVLFLTARNAPPKKSRATTIASVTAVAPPSATPSAQNRCAGERFCTPINFPDPANIVVEALIDECTKFATGIEPSAQLQSFDVMDGINAGAIDLTRQRAIVLFTYSIPNGELNIDAREGRFSGRKRPEGAPRALPDRTCTFKQVFDSAVALGFHFNVDSKAGFRAPFRNEKFEWQLTTDTETAVVDAQTCVARLTRR